MATRLAAEMPISHHYGPVESPLVPIDRKYAFRHYRPIHGMGLHRSQTYQSVTETGDSPTQEPATGRIVHVLVNQSVNNGADTAPAMITRVRSDEYVNLRGRPWRPS